MTQNESISLRELDIGEQEPRIAEQDTSNIDQADSRQWESSRKRACVLMGSAILQLPIWGELSLTSWLQFYSHTQALL